MITVFSVKEVKKLRVVLILFANFVHYMYLTLAVGLSITSVVTSQLISNYFFQLVDYSTIILYSRFDYF